MPNVVQTPSPVAPGSQCLAHCNMQKERSSFEKPAVPVYFSHNTALRIQRALPGNVLSPASWRRRRIPHEIPSREDIERAVYAVKTASAGGTACSPKTAGAGGTACSPRTAGAGGTTAGTGEIACSPKTAGAAGITSAVETAGAVAPPSSSDSDTSFVLADHTPIHYLVTRKPRPRNTKDRIAHVCSTTLSGTAFYRVADNVFIASSALAFVQIAALSKSFVDILQLGFELCGTYQTLRTASVSAYQVEPILTTQSISRFVKANPSLRGARKVSRLLRYLRDGSASPRETKLALLLGLPMMYGGYGLGMPTMNYEVQATPAAQAISNRQTFRCDLCWPSAKVDVEYQSRMEHESEDGHEGERLHARDSRRSNALKSMGWHVVEVTANEFESYEAMETIALSVRKLIGMRKQVRVDDYHARKLRLRRQLGMATHLGYE